MTYSDFRKQLASALDEVSDNHTPLLVTRQNGQAAVVISLEDFKSYEETAYLLSSANNAARIKQAIEELESGKGKSRGLLGE